MVDHKCQYATLIGKSPEWQTDEDGITVCKWCHEPKYKPVAKVTTRKVAK